MNYIIHYHHEIPADLSRAPSNIQSRIKKAIELKLLNDPFKYGEPLKRSRKGYRKMRVGDYRTIFRIQSKEIFILKIGHRKDVYKKGMKREDIH